MSYCNLSVLQPQRIATSAYCNLCGQWVHIADKCLTPRKPYDNDAHRRVLVPAMTSWANHDTYKRQTSQLMVSPVFCIYSAQVYCVECFHEIEVYIFAKSETLAKIANSCNTFSKLRLSINFLIRENFLENKHFRENQRDLQIFFLQSIPAGECEFSLKVLIKQQKISQNQYLRCEKFSWKS